MELGKRLVSAINCDTYKNIENANFKISNYETFGNKVFVFIKGIAYKI